MLDDLRNSASQSFAEDKQRGKRKNGAKDTDQQLIFGMTGPQRFFVSVLLLIMTITLGMLLLIAFGKMVI